MIDKSPHTPNAYGLTFAQWRDYIHQQNVLNGHPFIATLCQDHINLLNQ